MKFRGQMNKRRGVAIFIVIVVMMVLAILVLQLFFNSRQAQNAAHRFNTSEMARQLAYAGQEEAFNYVFNQTDNKNAVDIGGMSDIAKKIIERDTNIFPKDIIEINESTINRSSDTKIDLPITTALAKRNLGDIMNIKATIRIIDFRDKDFNGKKYYEKEGAGTLEIAVTVKAKDEFQKRFPGACTIIRHHEYKVVSILSDKRNKYSGARFLDYALFIKGGQDTFQAAGGYTLNPSDSSSKISLEVKAGEDSDSEDSLGKVNLGSGNNDYQYLNISNDTIDFLKFSNGEAGKNPQKIAEANDSWADKIFPDFTKAFKDDDADEVKGHKLVFYHYRLPVNESFFNTDALKAFRNLAAKDSKYNLKKAIFFDEDTPLLKDSGIIIQPKNKLDKILKSDVRKHFFNFGYFKLDLSNCEVKADGDWFKIEDVIREEPNSDFAKDCEKFKKAEIVCFDKNYSFYYKNNSNNDQKKCTEELRKFIDTQSPEIASQAFTFFNDEMPYQEKDELDPSKRFTNERFYNKSGNETSPSGATRAYDHYNLWARRNMKASDLVSLGILKNNELNLRGIVHCSDPVTLGDPGTPLTINGSGVLIARGITIKGEIKKANEKSVCVLYSRDGYLDVNTDKPIKAVLIALRGENNYGSEIRVKNNKLDLTGGLITEILRLYEWKKGVTHKVTYDKALLPRDVYQINILKPVTFERVVENE